MHTIDMLYNNFGLAILLMKTQNMNQNNGLNSGNFFYPRIIREFEDKDEPMMYWRKNND